MSYYDDASYDIEQAELNEDRLFEGHGPTSIVHGKLIHSTNMGGTYQEEQSHTPEGDYEGELYFDREQLERTTHTLDELVADSMNERHFDNRRYLLSLPKYIRDELPAYQNLLNDVTENMVHALEEQNIETEYAHEANGLSVNMADLTYEMRTKIQQNALGNSFEHYKELALRNEYEPMSAADDTHPPLNEIEQDVLAGYEVLIHRQAALQLDVNPDFGNTEPEFSEKVVPDLKEPFSGRVSQWRRYTPDIDTEEFRVELKDLEKKQKARHDYEADPESLHFKYYGTPAPLTEEEQARMAELEKFMHDVEPDEAELEVRKQEFIDDLAAKLQERGFDLEAIKEAEQVEELDFGFEDDFGR